MLHLPVGQEQPVGAEEDAVHPVDAAQPDRKFRGFQHASNLGVEWAAQVRRQHYPPETRA